MTTLNFRIQYGTEVEVGIPDLVTNSLDKVKRLIDPGVEEDTYRMGAWKMTRLWCSPSRLTQRLLGASQSWEGAVPGPPRTGGTLDTYHRVWLWGLHYGGGRALQGREAGVPRRPVLYPGN